MKKIKLYKLLRCLEEHELPGLDKFLASPYFNTASWPLRLWRRMKQAHPDYEQLDREEIFQDLEPGQTFTGKFINDRYSELSLLVEEFMAMEEFRRNSKLSAPARREALYRRKLYPEFEKECQGQLRSLERQRLRDADNLAAALSVYEALYSHPEAISHKSGDKEVAQLMDCLDQHFILLKLKYLSDLLARQLTFNETHDTRFQQAVLKEAAMVQESSPLAGMYYRICRLFQDKCPEEDFKFTLESFYRLAPALPSPEKSFILTKLITLADDGVKSKGSFYLKALFGLMQYGESHRLFIYNNAITELTFINACTVGAYLKEYEWVGRFIENNRPYLPASVAGEACTLARAGVLFNQKDYQAAHSLLNEIHKKRIPLKLRIRSLDIRCLLGMHLENPGYLKSIRYALLTFNRFIGKDRELSAELKAGYLNFSMAVRQIAELRKNAWDSPKAREEAAAWLEALEPMALRPWLLDQLKLG